MNKVPNIHTNGIQSVAKIFSRTKILCNDKFHKSWFKPKPQLIASNNCVGGTVPVNSSLMQIVETLLVRSQKF